MIKGHLRAVLYADQNSRVDFYNPADSAIVKQYRSIFGDRVDFKFVTAAEVRDGRAFHGAPHVFIMPGIFGERCYYADHLGFEGNERIRQFVREGGTYKGYCAGAYYALQNVNYIPLQGETRRRGADTNLALLNADGIGPVGTYCQPTTAPRDAFPTGLHRVDPVPVELTDTNKVVQMAYGFGPAFRIAAGSDIRITGRYAGIKGKPPAIIEGRYGRGQVILYGTLPQFSYDCIGTRNVQPEVRHLRDMLYEHRQALADFSALQLGRVAQYHGLALI